MAADEVFSETVVFELVDPQTAERLWERLRPRWFASIYKCDAGAFVAVELRPEEEWDLAILLRTVQFWGRESGAAAIPFHVDGHAYVLETKVALWPAVA